MQNNGICKKMKEERTGKEKKKAKGKRGMGEGMRGIRSVRNEAECKAAPKPLKILEFFRSQ